MENDLVISGLRNTEEIGRKCRAKLEEHGQAAVDGWAMISISGQDFVLLPCPWKQLNTTRIF
jgi:hypothetical protein